MPEFRLDDLRPVEVESYLTSRRWEFLREVNFGSIWVTPDDEGAGLNVFVPHRTDFADYDRRVLDVVRTLSTVEQRSEQEVIRDLVEASADVIRFRLPYTVADDSVRLADALTLFQRAREAIRAAALSAVEPKPVYSPGGAPHQVESFLDGLRLGHTERGSYVVPVISPLGTIEAGPDEVIPRTDEPFGRFVTLRFSAALSAVDDALTAARKSDDLTPFAHAVPLGVSANLCSAVGELTRIGSVSGAGDDRPPATTINFSWAPSRPVTRDVQSSFEIAAQDASLLQDAADFLKKIVPRPQVVVVGQVVRLERQQSEPDGSIGIRGELEGAERTVVVRLRSEDYARALHAHDLRLPVTCSGVLERRGTHWHLVEPIEFQAADQLF